MDAGHWALLILSIVMLALAVTMTVLYLVQVERTGKAKDTAAAACKDRDTAVREAEALRVQLEAVKKAAEVATKSTWELINDATTAHPPGGPLAGPPEPDLG